MPNRFQQQLADLVGSSPRSGCPMDITPRAMKRHKTKLTLIGRARSAELPDTPDKNLEPSQLPLVTSSSRGTTLFLTPGRSPKRVYPMKTEKDSDPLPPPPPANVNPFCDTSSTSTPSLSNGKIETVTSTSKIGSTYSSANSGETDFSPAPLWRKAKSPALNVGKISFHSPAGAVPLKRDRISTPSPAQSKVESADYYLSRKLKRTCSIQESNVEKKFRLIDSPATHTPGLPAPPVLTKSRKRTPEGEVTRTAQPTELSRFKYEFELLAVLGGGTFGTVYKCKARLDGCFYAVKVTKQKFKGSADRERVLKEVYALAAVCNNEDNPYIVRYFSAWIEEGRLYIQTELCDISLQDMLKDSSKTDSNLQQIAVTMVRQMLHALSRLHRQNIVHLDIKPANIFIKNGVYKLGDLGHACLASIQNSSEDKMIDETIITVTQGEESDVLRAEQAEEAEWMRRKARAAFIEQIDEGDSRYMSQELLQENYNNLPKCDIFSLGASTYEIGLRAELPSNGEAWARIRRGQLGYIDDPSSHVFSEELKELVRLMMHPDPLRRPTAQTLLACGGPKGILRSEFEAKLAREKAAADNYRKQLARIKSHGAILAADMGQEPLSITNRIRRSNTL